MNYPFISSSPPSLSFHNSHHQHTDDGNEVPTLYQTLTERKKNTTDFLNSVNMKDATKIYYSGN